MLINSAQPGTSFSSRFKLSLIAVWIVIAGIIYGHVSLPRHDYNFYNNEITFDVVSYYLYLPMNFIYDDIGIRDKSTIDTIFARYNPSPTFFQAFELENGNRVLNYTCGFAYAYAPFFFIGHIWALNSDYLVDGFSFPYQISVALGVFVYILLGWFVLRLVLRKFFPDHIVALVLLLIAFGTNYYSEAINNYLQPHAMLFSGYCVLLYAIIRWHEKPAKRWMMIGGLTMGWLILSRPSEIVCVLLPVLWGIYDKDSLLAKIKLIRENLSHIALLIIFGLIPFIPQFIYWKIVTGQAIFFSYQRTEGFDFLQPHIGKVLFSFKKSLFVYTPILLFPVIGFFFLKKYARYVQWAVIVYLLANFYLLASWAAWWNGGSFGMRYFAESYTVMAIPFGFALMEIAKSRWWVKLLSTIAISFFVFLNLFQTWQFVNWIIPDDRMTYKYYKRIFLKTHVTEEDRKLMEVQRSFSSVEFFTNEHEYDHYTLAEYDFDNNNATVIDPGVLDTTHYLSPPYSCKLSEQNLYYPTYRIQYKNLVKPDRDHVWLRVSLSYFSETDIKDNPASIVINMPHGDYNLKYRAFDFEKKPFTPGEWNTISIEYMTPFPYNENDSFEIYVWYRGKSQLFIDNMKIEVFDRKY